MGRRQNSSSGPRGHDAGGSLRWLLTYADMITLLMAFFIMLYSMSILNLNKFRQVAVSIRSGFGGRQPGQGQSVLSTEGRFSIKPSPLSGTPVGIPSQVLGRLERFVRQQKLQKSIKLRMDERGLVISLVTDKVLFARGQAELSGAAMRIIDGIASVLKQIPNQLRIEGHTCDLPIVSDRYPSNWELSTARATTVVRHLIEHEDIAPGRLSAAGYADSKPLVPNTSEANRALNRRVDIIILRSGYRDNER